MSQVAIEVKNVSKEFVVPHKQVNSLKQLFVNVGKKNKKETFKALSDVSFTINKGEFFGIVGRNGSGKSTMLKMLAGVYIPTKGRIDINGSLIPFIELGVGFNPELSGRDNVFLNGALLGFTRKQMLAMYDEIIDFAELKDFMDVKLKNYSSGMQVRLAFAIAIRAETDILLIDEVLAVGDSDFQNKCLDYFKEIKNKKTVVFVTHDMNAVSNFCDRVAVIDRGDLVHLGDVSGAIEKYYNQFSDRTDKEKQSKLFSGGTKWVSSDLVVKIKLEEVIKGCEGLGLALFSENGDYIFGTNTFIDSHTVESSNQELIIENLKQILLPGKYYFKVGIFGKSDMHVIQFYDRQLEFTVGGTTKYHGVVNFEHNWKGAK